MLSFDCRRLNKWYDGVAGEGGGEGTYLCRSRNPVLPRIDHLQIFSLLPWNILKFKGVLPLHWLALECLSSRLGNDRRHEDLADVFIHLTHVSTNRCTVWGEGSCGFCEDKQIPLAAMHGNAAGYIAFGCLDGDGTGHVKNRQHT